MKLAFIAFLLAPIAGFSQALPYVPSPTAAYVSTTGLPGSWSPMVGSGTATIPYVPTPSGLYCSTDGTGNVGTWVPCTGTGGGGGSVSITSPGSTLTLTPSPLTGTGTAEVNLAHENTWTAPIDINVAGQPSQMKWTESTAATGLAGAEIMWADSTQHRMMLNNNNGGANAVATFGDLGSSSAFGLLKCGTGITCTSGVASASGTAYISPYGTLAPSTPPLSTSLSWINQGTVTANDVNGLNIHSAGTVATAISSLVTTLPATPYTFTVAMRVSCASGACPSASAVNFGGITIQDASGKQVVLIINEATGSSALDFQTYNGSTFVTTYAQQLTGAISPGTIIWLRMVDDGTNFTASYSFDGSFFFQLGTPQSRTAFLTSPNSIGIAVNDWTSGTIVQQNVFIPYWKLG